jgi:tetratricopeptide (TPR) repeat protein
MRSSVRQLLVSAIGDYRAGRSDRALARCRHVLADDPGEPAAHQLLAALTLGRGQPLRAVRAAGRSLALRPGHAETLELLGDANRALGRSAEAADAYGLVARLTGGLRAGLRQATALIEARGFAEAEAVLVGLLRDHPGHPAALVALGLACKGQGRLEAALDAFRRAEGQDPALAEAAFNRGNTLRDLGREAEAINGFYRAVALKPDHPGMGFNLGLALQAAGRTAAAGRVMARVVRLAPGFAAAWFNLGILRQAAGDGAGAVAAWRSALCCQPVYPEAAINLAITLQHAGRLRAALAAYGRAWRQDPGQFGRISQALCTEARGLVFLDPGRLRAALLANGAGFGAEEDA